MKGKFFCKNKSLSGVAILIACLFSLNIAAQDFTSSRFSHLTTRDGLSQSSVYAMLQDRLGFMWFGTTDGLNMYDGYTFKTFRFDASRPDSLVDSWVGDLLEDSSGRIWVGAFGPGLAYLNQDRQTFTRVDLGIDLNRKGFGQNKVLSLLEDNRGNIWVGTENTGIIVVKPDLSIQRLQHNPDDPRSLVSDEIRDLAMDKNGHIWVATTKGLDRYDPDIATFRHFKHDPNDPNSLPSNRCTALYYDPDGFLWIGSNEAGLTRLNPSDMTFKHFMHDPDNPDSLSNPSVTAIQEDSRRGIWVGTKAGLNLLNRKTGGFRHFDNDPDDDTSLGDNNVLCLMEDKGGVFWVGTYANGLSKLSRAFQGFRLYQTNPKKPEGLQGAYILDMIEAQDGTIWLGTWDSGLNIFDPVNDTFKHYPKGNQPGQIPNIRVNAILQDRSGVIRIGSGKHLLQYIPETDQFESIDLGPDLGLNRQLINHIYEDMSGHIWVSTYGWGLGDYNPETDQWTWRTYDPDREDTINNNLVNNVLEDKAGRFWVGTEFGLARLNRRDNVFVRYLPDTSNPQGLSHSSVMSIYEDSKNRIWLATYGGGLVHFDPDSEIFTSYTRVQGLPNNSLYGMLEDDRGNLWLSTNGGLCKFNPEDQTAKTYDNSNFLYNNEFNRNGYLRTRAGEFFFGGVGFYRFRPEDIKGNSYHPPVRLTKLLRFGEEMDLPAAPSQLESLTLEHDDSVISFSFAAMDYTNPQHNRFRCRMVGFKQEWIELGTKSDITYTNLGPGDYTFNVMGANNDGVWSDEMLSLSIKVKPPYWATTWAYIIYATLAIGLFLGYIRYRERQKQKELQRAFSVGKAQFASTVLHNIGNVLNSLKVSLDQSRVTLKDSKIRQLTKAHSLMKGHMDNLPEFLTHDEKGKLLPGYFISAGEILLEEHGEIKRELDEMSRKIFLMNDIIESQQAHAKQELITETHDLNLVIDEALTVFQGSFEKSKVRIVRNFNDIPPVKAHKSQLMHIVINLAKNAIEAMEHKPEETRVLTLETGRSDQDHAFLKVSDKGYGIDPDDLDKMFTYGFTTKEEGHGFGLHSCAKAMREMGGNIKVTSEGKDKGATFFLTFTFGIPLEL